MRRYNTKLFDLRFVKFAALKEVFINHNLHPGAKSLLKLKRNTYVISIEIIITIKYKSRCLDVTFGHIAIVSHIFSLQKLSCLLTLDSQFKQSFKIE